MTDDDYLSAYLDGELDAPDQATLEARMATDVALQARLDCLRAADTLLRNGMRAADAAPMPMGVLSLLGRSGGTGTNVELPIPANDRGDRWWLRAAVMAGLFIGGGTLGMLVATRGPARDMLSPDAALVAALDAQPSARRVSSGKDGSIVMRVSFPGIEPGQWCRQFDITGLSGFRSGVACRVRDGWQVKALVARTASPTSTDDMYSVAEGSADPALDPIIAALRGGDPIAPAEEARIIARHWQAN